MSIQSSDFSGNTSFPTLIDRANWRQQARKPNTSECRSDYKMYLKMKKLEYIYKTLKTGNQTQIVSSLFQTLALPLATLTGSKELEKLTAECLDAFDLYSDPLSWVAGKASHYVGDKVSHFLGSFVSNPELKDVIDISCGELSAYGANLAVIEVGKKRKRCEQKASILAAKKLKIQQEKHVLHEYSQDSEELQRRNEKVSKLPLDPQFIADCAYNSAESIGLKDNIVQISLEASKAVNTLSIGNPDPYRNTDTFKTAQKGSKKNHNQHIVNRIGDFIPQILHENEQTLKDAFQKVEQQKQNISSTQQEALQFEQSLDFFESIYNDFFAATQTEHCLSEKPPAVLESPIGNNINIEQFIKNMYAANEDKAKPAHEQKLEIAKGIATDLCKLANNDSQREVWIHQIYNSMDGSGRRWSNDACGEVHYILFGVRTDDFAYHERGLKNIWSQTTTPFKKVFSWLDEHYSGNGRFTVGGTVDLNRDPFVNSSKNPQLFKISETNPTSEYSEQSFLFPAHTFPVVKDDEERMDKQLPSILEEEEYPSSHVPSSSSTQLHTIISHNKNSTSPVSIDNSSYISPSVFNGTAYAVADASSQALKNLDNVPNMHGIGSYAGKAVQKIVNVVGTLERIDDQAYREEPAVQRIGCGIWGTVVELAGEAITAPLKGLTAVVGAAALSSHAENAGDHAQKNCHEVIDMFKSN